MIILCCGLTWLIFNKIDQKKVKATYAKVSIELINTCQVFDDAFVVKVEPTGQIAFFNDKKTEIYVRMDHKIRLAASPKFPDFVYDGEFVEAGPHVQLIANCDAPERIQKTLDALKNQFKR